MSHRFVGLGEDGEKVFLYDGERKKVRQVLWGDFLFIDDEEHDGDLGDGWLPVIWAPKSPNRRRLFIPERHTADKRPLEIIFVDVGQGDGAVLISPERHEDERIMVIDAGEGDNMQRFLNGRFRAYRGFDFEAAVITHPDSDHYRGFEEIFADHDIGFNTVYQSGLVERPVSGTFEKLGGLTEDPQTGIKYLEDLALDNEDIERHFRDTSNFGRKHFPPVMHNALENPKVENFRMLSTAHGAIEGERSYMPGFAPSDGRGYTIEVLGPFVEFSDDGRPRLRRISSRYGETKNGHSVILRLRYRDLSVLFGGDLNVPAEKFLLTQYTDRDHFPDRGSADYEEMIHQASERFGADVMKVCHHGSAEVTDAFMAAVNPACFVISSGDQEGHVHPRPDLLGRLGKFGRGDSPVILSTELQRSTREREDRRLVDGLLRDVDRLADAHEEELRVSVRSRIRELGRRNVEVYGAIYLKTDGERLITAFKIEAESDLDKWFYFEYRLNEAGILTLVH